MPAGAYGGSGATAQGGKVKAAARGKVAKGARRGSRFHKSRRERCGGAQIRLPRRYRCSLTLSKARRQSLAAEDVGSDAEPMRGMARVISPDFL